MQQSRQFNKKRPSATREECEERERHSRRIERLFKEHNDSLIRFLTARLHSEAEAREIAQEAYVRMLKLDEPDAVSYLRAFLFRTAANLVQDRLKQRQRRYELRQSVFFDAQQSSPALELGLEADETLAIIASAIEELPPKCRKAFLMHKIRGVEVQDVANDMALSIRMVRLYVARALAHCQESLELAEREHR